MDNLSYSETGDDKQRVLIIDDSTGNIHNLNEILKQDYDVFFAINGKDGISKAVNNQIDLILLDIQMPEMDGYEVCRQLKKRDETREIPVIFVTAMDEIGDEAQGLDAGAIDYIVKPYSHRIVEARVRNHMELVRHRKMLKSMSLTDALTGLPNRRQFDEIFDREWRRGHRQKSILAVMLIDVDHFKRYNDYYGHQQGDICLQKIAWAFARCRRRMTDFVGRYGGEEFVAVLPTTDQDGALTMANKMLEILRDQKIPHAFNGNFDIVTTSIGLFTGVPDNSLTAKQMMEKADQALYMAKNAGRNQVVMLQDNDLKED